MAWQFNHSIETRVSREFAWRFWTDVENWSFDPAIEWVKLDGPFRVGAKGTTRMKGADLVNWEITDLKEGESALIEIPLPGAIGRFFWRFEELSKATTRITQQITLRGPQAEMYEAQMGPEMEQGIRAGMEALGKALEIGAHASKHEYGEADGT